MKSENGEPTILVGSDSFVGTKTSLDSSISVKTSVRIRHSVVMIKVRVRGQGNVLCQLQVPTKIALQRCVCMLYIVYVPRGHDS